MTVHCLNDYSKASVVDFYLEIPTSDTINRCAEFHCVSRRTIIRVLEEAGLDPIKHRKPKKLEVAPIPHISEWNAFDPAVDLTGFPVKAPPTKYELAVMALRRLFNTRQ